MLTDFLRSCMNDCFTTLLETMMDFLRFEVSLNPGLLLLALVALETALERMQKEAHKLDM